MKNEENDKQQNSSGVGTLNLTIVKEDNNNQETIESIQIKKLQINNMNVNIKNYRMDNFKQLRNKFEKISVSTKHQKSFVLEKIFKNSNKEKNDKVIHQINSLLANIDNLKTKSTAWNPEVKDSLLNSYKDFIVVKEIDKFYDGMPILQLKKEQFLKNTKIFEIKNKLERSRHKIDNNISRNMLMIKELKEEEYNYNNNGKHKNVNFSSKNLGNNYKLNFNKNNINKSDNEKDNFFTTGLNMKKGNSKNISPMKKNVTIPLELDLNKIFEDEHKSKDIIQSLNDDKVLRKKFILPKINHKEVSVELLPEKFDIYSKIKIKDLIGLSQLIKPIFKY